MADKKNFRYGHLRGIGCIIGHRECIPKVKHPLVPKVMGWLWTAKDAPGLKYHPEWKPGAVQRNVLKKQRRVKPESSENLIDVVKKQKKKKKSSHFVDILEEDQDSENILEPAFLVRKKDGNYTVTVQPIKEEVNRHVSKYPYEEIDPYNVKIENRTREKIDKKARKREYIQRQNKMLACQQALNEICNEVYQYIDQSEFQTLAEKNNECPCSFLQSEILKMLVCSYVESKCNQNTSKTSLESEKLVVHADLIENLIECFGDGNDDDPIEGNANGDSLASSSCKWSVEFNPPVAKWDPNVINEAVHKKEKGTQFVHTDSHEVESVSKPRRKKIHYFKY